MKCLIFGCDVNFEMVCEVGNVEVGMCCGGCKGKVDVVEGDDKFEFVFSIEVFKKGFEIVKDDDGE